ncbi:MAG: hypothetical protein IPP69_06510 [Flavobacteriales bacterium]|nr:hypothetical protein [Flavobacteriales bacterium]
MNFDVKLGLMQNDKNQNKEKGDKGEELAAAYLMEHGYVIIHKNGNMPDPKLI